MYYLELIERFWIFNEKAKPGSTAIAMYLYLLETAKACDDYDFQVSDVVLSKELGLTRPTVKLTKEKLRDLGLIKFRTKNGIPCSYRLVLSYSLETSEPVKIENDKAELLQTFQKYNDDEDPLIRRNRFESSSLIAGDEIKLSSPQLANENIEIPEFEEFLAYAQALAAYYPELDVLVKGKYYSWKDNGWKNNADRLITNWKSSLKSTLPFLKNAADDDQLSLQTIPDIKRPKSSYGK